MLFKAVLFDLDGTLLDTAPDFILSMNLLLSKYDKPLITESEIDICIFSFFCYNELYLSQ